MMWGTLWAAPTAPVILNVPVSANMTNNHHVLTVVPNAKGTETYKIGGGVRVGV